MNSLNFININIFLKIDVFINSDNEKIRFTLKVLKFKHRLYSKIWKTF